jgi:hypothetical protein
MDGTLTLVADRKISNRWRVVDPTNNNATLAAIQQADTALWHIFEAVDPGTPVLTAHFPTRDEAFAAYQEQHRLRQLCARPQRNQTCSSLSYNPPGK